MRRCSLQPAREIFVVLAIALAPRAAGAQGTGAHPPEENPAGTPTATPAATPPPPAAPAVPSPAGAAAASPPASAPPAAPARIVTLAEVERAAIENQPQLVAARATTAGAEAQADQLRAPLLPQVTATASYTRETGNFAPRPGALPGGGGSLPSPSLTQSFDFWNFGVAGSQLIYDFGQTIKRYDAAKSTADADRITERTTRVQVLSLVRRSFFNARANKELVDVARQTLDDQNRHLTQVQGFVQVGTQPAIALAQQRSSVASAQVQLITAQNNYETAKAQLNQAAGLRLDTDYGVGDDELGPVEGEDDTSDALAQRALANRPELAALEKQRESQERALSAAKGGYGATLSALAGFTYAGTVLDDLVPNWSAEILMTWPIFQGGLTIGQVRQAEAGLQGIDAQRSLEVLQVRLDVDSARLAVRAAKATIQASEDAVVSAREQLRLAEQRYVTGVGSIIELTDAQVTYTSAAAQAVQARYALSSARALLLAALGRT